MSKRPPVIDWSTDFDHLDPCWTENPYPIWDEFGRNARLHIPTVSWALILLLATRTCARSPMTPSTSPRAGPSSRDAPTVDTGTADYFRSARALAGQKSTTPRFHA